MFTALLAVLGKLSKLNFYLFMLLRLYQFPHKLEEEIEWISGFKIVQQHFSE